MQIRKGGNHGKKNVGISSSKIRIFPESNVAALRNACTLSGPGRL